MPSVVAYSGSSSPTMRFDHSNKRPRSSWGTPMMSAMACRGSSAATSVTKSQTPLLDDLVDDRGGAPGERLLYGLHRPRGEAAVDETPVAGVAGRVRGDHHRAPRVSAPTPLARSSGSSRLMLPTSEEKSAASRFTVTTSPCRTTLQKPRPCGWSCHETGSSRRSARTARPARRVGTYRDRAGRDPSDYSSGPRVVGHRGRSRVGTTPSSTAGRTNRRLAGSGRNSKL